jgi:multidrug efflux pump subunit AcrB
MNIAEFSIRNKTLILVLTALMLVGGIASFNDMSRLEDPEFTIKDALIITAYPGASALEVEQEVTDELEKAVQQMSQVDQVTSKSDRGLSTLTVTIKDNYDNTTLPQVWDELRRKVGDAQGSLPPGAGASSVIDDYGDVFGIFINVYGSEYTYAEIKTVVDMLRRELLLVEDVAKIETFGERTEVVYVEFSRDRISQLGIPVTTIVTALQQKNVVADAGKVKVGSEFITIEPTGAFNSVKDFESLLISASAGQQIYLKDIATVRRGYLEPQSSMTRFDGNPGIGIGISTISGGNVVRMGEALTKRVTELSPEIPLGIEFGIISMQSDAVNKAIDSFVSSLLQAVVIVVVVLLFFMGLRSGLLIGFILLITICGSFIFLEPMGVALERISLGALIIALGMLVDNAIVIVDGMLIRLQKGMSAHRAATDVVKQSALPLLGATVIAILAFAAIGTSDDSTGEFCRSLFQVVMVSLLLSWVTAVTITPLLGVMFLKAPKNAAGKDPYQNKFYSGYKGLLNACLKKRGLTLVLVVSMFASSLWGFRYIEQSFFPPSTRPQLMVDLWLPQGTHINETQDMVAQVEVHLMGQSGITHVNSLIGKGGLRFLLTYAPEKSNTAYAQLLVDVDDPKLMDGMISTIEAYLDQQHPDVQGYVSKFQLGPGSTGKIQARFSGPDPDVLRDLADQSMAIMSADFDSKAIRTNWRQRVKLLQPIIAEEQANLNGITRTDIANVLRQGFEGSPIGIYREGDLLLPIVLRAEDRQRNDVASINNLQIWSPAAQKTIPLRQVVTRFETSFEDEIVQRRDRKRTIIAFADPIKGVASELFVRVRPAIEAIDLPPGYSLEWGGEYEDSADAQNGLMGNLPVFLLLMIVITIALFNNIRQPLIIWLCVPLALIGVTAGLLTTSQPFGFMALLGFLSLSGMLIKNAIVLIDQINLELSEGKALIQAIVDSGVSRLRPVSMAAGTTALGMIPLLMDAFFVSMAVTIIFGLVFATLLTMVLVPVLYATFYKEKEALNQ